jgi:hypothetical protein
MSLSKKEGDCVAVPFFVTYMIVMLETRAAFCTRLLLIACYSSNHISFAGLSFSINFTSSSLMPKPMLIRISTVAHARG